MCTAEEMTDQWYTFCQRVVKMVKMDVHQKNGISATAKRAEKFG